MRMKDIINKGKEGFKKISVSVSSEPEAPEAPKSKKKSKKSGFRTALEQEFLTGARYTVPQLMLKYFKLDTIINALTAEKKIRSALNDLRRSMYQKHGVMFGCITDTGLYGIAKTEGEYRFVGTKRYTLTKGILANTYRWMKEAKDNGFLLEKGEVVEEKVSLPRITENDTNE